MSKLDDILQSIDLQNKIFGFINGIDHLIRGAYGGDDIQTSPEVLNKAKHLFTSLEWHLMQSEMVILPRQIGNLIGSYLLDDCLDKPLFGKLLENKFVECEFDTEVDFAGFFDYCTAGERFDVADAALEFLGGLRKLAEDLNVLFPVQQKRIVRTSESRYEYDPAFCTVVYDFCMATGVFCGITHAEFCNCVANANFARIYDSEGRLAAKLKYIIYVLGRRMDNPQWYADAAHSVGTEPNKCSGATVPAEWKKQALAIK